MQTKQQKSEPAVANIFNYATTELSHSAYWAWTFAALNSKAPELDAPRKVARVLSEKLGAKLLVTPVEVEREFPIDGGRIDVLVTDANGYRLAIENKVSAIPDITQVKKYKKALGQRSHVALVSTAFDLDVRPDLESIVGYAGLDEIIEIEMPEAPQHPLVADHYRWAREILRRREELFKDAISSDQRKNRQALGTPEGQWSAMKHITQGIVGQQYRGANVGGKPWTQFCFTDESDSSRHDHLFYRIDDSAKGFYFALRQYQHDPYPDVLAKKRRRERLRAWWNESLAATSSKLVPSRPRNSGAKESEVALFLLKENPLHVLAQEVTRVHHYFSRRLKSEGWALFA